MAVMEPEQRQRMAPVAAPRSRWLSVVSHLDPKYGGVSTVVPQLASRLARGPSAEPSSDLHTALTSHSSFDVQIEAFCLPGEEHRPASAGDLPIHYWPTSRRRWLLERTLPQQFRARIAEADAVHIHGLWEHSTLEAARTAQRLRKPYILSAHGMLEPWALERSRAKKKVYAALFERPNLQAASCLHALTGAEARNYRGFGAKGPIAIIPNGVDVPSSLDPEPFFAQFPATRGKRLVLFLGRLHAKKGVDLLLGAWASLAREFPNACLVLAGPPEDATGAGLPQLAESLGVAAQTLCTGMLQPTMKWSALAAAEIFALPSHSEGLSVATLEAMGAGVPVIVTRECNLPEAAEHGAGWEIPLTVEALRAALETSLRNTPEANKAMGRKGAALVERQYSWAVVAGQMAELYRWVERFSAQSKAAQGKGAQRTALPASFPILMPEGRR